MESGDEDVTMQNVADAALRVAERFGVPVVLLAAMLWMVREAATSLHNTVVIPIVRSHTEFLESTRETLHEISKVQSKQADTLGEIVECQVEIRNAVIRSGTSPRPQR